VLRIPITTPFIQNSWRKGWICNSY